MGEMNSGTLIPNSRTGSVTCGPKVPDDFDIVVDNWGGYTWLGGTT